MGGLPTATARVAESTVPRALSFLIPFPFTYYPSNLPDILLTRLHIISYHDQLRCTHGSEPGTHEGVRSCGAVSACRPQPQGGRKAQAAGGAGPQAAGDGRTAALAAL